MVLATLRTPPTRAHSRPSSVREKSRAKAESMAGILTARGGPAGQLPARSHVMAGVPGRILLQVVLVLGLGFPEIARRRHFGHHLARPQAAGLDVGDGVLGHAPLLRRGVEDRRAVGGADVVALAVARGRVVDLEEELEQVAITGLRRVEHDLHRLGVAAVVAVGRIGHVAAAVAHAGGGHTRHLAQQLLHAPEAAAGEDRALRAHAGSSTWSRYSAYPSASIRSRGMKRSAAELMQ